MSWVLARAEEEMSRESSFDPMVARSPRVDGGLGGRSSICFGFRGVFSEPHIRAHAGLMNSRTGTTRPVLSTVLLEGTEVAPCFVL